MILGFKQKFPWGKPTNFREKILMGVDRMVVRESDGNEFITKPTWSTKYAMQVAGIKPKIHTMRTDPHDRWKAGMSIQMVYRGPKYSILDHFNEGIPELEKCVSTQKVKIEWFTFHSKPFPIMGLKAGDFRHMKLTIDGKEWAIDYVARNDGFESVDNFKRWFNKDWEGKLIHWTDFRY